ncbi:MAG: riboflavin synthase [candidate division WOR-3 bacterium]|nr:riboflavin synthase [candidate division WOR-3 bacterium]
MFTGIIEEKGKILKFVKGSVSKMEIKSTLDVKIGDSIAVQGICLTVTAITKNGFAVEVMTQTKERTTMDNWKTGDYVNLERALSFNGRIGGHIVLGHIDEVARIIQIKGNEYYFLIAPDNQKFLIPRGSITIDGVSLTVGNISKNIFSVFLIPHTLNSTTLGQRKKGDLVNIEYDYLVKIIKNSLF